MDVIRYQDQEYEAHPGDRFLVTKDGQLVRVAEEPIVDYGGVDGIRSSGPVPGLQG